MSHTRMAFFTEYGLSLESMKKVKIGPVVFYEHTHYFREVFLGTPIVVSLETTGLSEEGTFFRFTHNFYDFNGRNLATCEVLGAFIDLNNRKLTALPAHLLEASNDFPRSGSFEVLTKENTRKFDVRPKDISL